MTVRRRAGLMLNRPRTGAAASQPSCPPATTRSLWELVGALGQADTLDGLEDDLFTSCFLAIACSLARHLSGAQQDLSSDASPHRAMVIHPKQALKSIPWLLLSSLQASQEGKCMASTVLLAEQSAESSGIRAG
ncbi:unnamed protein product [Lepidochelys kempii]